MAKNMETSSGIRIVNWWRHIRPSLRDYWKDNKNKILTSSTVIILAFIAIGVLNDSNFFLSLFLGVIVAALIHLFIVSMYKKVFTEDTVIDRRTGSSMELIRHDCGSAMEATWFEKEREKSWGCAEYGQSFENFLGMLPTPRDVDVPIGFVEPGTKFFYFKEGFGLNGNRCYFGKPGVGKSFTILTGDIFQTILRGESMIVTDTKGELYNNTYSVAKAYGYTIKILNLDPKFMVHSDSCDPFRRIIEDPNLVKSFSNTIISNIAGSDVSASTDFWAKENINLMSFFLLLVAFNELGIEKTLGGFYRFLNTITVDQILEIGGMLPDDHPAKVYYNNFASIDNTQVQGNILGGLQADLSVLGQPIMQVLFSTDDIDFSLPAKKKCIYYVNLPANDRSNICFSALFFDSLFISMEDVARENGGHCPVRVKCYMDETYNIGVIPCLDSRLGTLRSAGIDIYLFFQTLSQMMTMYPEPQYHSVYGCCSIIGCLGTTDQLTMDFISYMCGEQSIKTPRFEADGLTINSWSVKDRPVYTPHEVRVVPPTNMLLIPSNGNVIELRKVASTNHPLTALVRPVYSTKHLPNWVKGLDEDKKSLYGIKKTEVYEEEKDWNLSPLAKGSLSSPWGKEEEADRQARIILYNRGYKNAFDDMGTRNARNLSSLVKDKGGGRFVADEKAIERFLKSGKLDGSVHYDADIPSHTTDMDIDLNDNTLRGGVKEAYKAAGRTVQQKQDSISEQKDRPDGARFSKSSNSDDEIDI